jgi:hypothetical protein
MLVVLCTTASCEMQRAQDGAIRRLEFTADTP